MANASLPRRVRRAGQLVARSRQAGLGGMLLLLKAFALLLTARVALRLIPVRRIIAWKQRPLPPAPSDFAAQAQCARVRQAVLVVARYSPLRFVCFPRCLAASALLRQAGIESRLHYGVARENDKLITHTWLEACGEILIGGEVAEQFSTLAIY